MTTSLGFGTPSAHIERRYLECGANVLIRGGQIESWSLSDTDRHARQAASACADRRYPRSRHARLTYTRLLMASTRNADDDPGWSEEMRADIAAVWSGIAADDARWLACRAAVRRLRVELAEASREVAA
jgi:hypothetical protein